ncbi:unnamed protein product [Rhizopus stolonifer]
MKLLTITTLVFILFICKSLSQEQNATNQNASSIISQYGRSFKNQGGTILNDHVNVYIIFYGDWTSTQAEQEQHIFMHFIENISNSPWFKLFDQYSDNSEKTVSGPLELVAAVNDLGSHSLNLTKELHKQIVDDAIRSGYLSPLNRVDHNGIYIIMGGPNVNDSEFCTVNCGYNGHSDDFQYMFIGYPGICPESCIPGTNVRFSPNNLPAMDAAISIFSHEVQDVLTNPRKDAWYMEANDTLIELGDFCSSEGTASYQFGNITRDTGGIYNLELAGRKYLVQTIFDLETKHCSLGNNKTQ